MAGVVVAKARRAAPGHDGPGHLVRGLVDHLVAEHDRAAGLYAGGDPAVHPAGVTMPAPVLGAVTDS